MDQLTCVGCRLRFTLQKGSGISSVPGAHGGSMHFSFSTIVMCGHFLRPIRSRNFLVRILNPIPQVLEHSDHSDQSEVWQIPSLPRIGASGSSSSSPLSEKHKFHDLLIPKPLATSCTKYLRAFGKTGDAHFLRYKLPVATQHGGLLCHSIFPGAHSKTFTTRYRAW